MSSKDNTTITIPLSDLISILLGDFYGSMSGSPNATVPPDTALILENILKDSQSYKIIWPENGDGNPKLWHFNAWIADQNRIAKQKEYAEAERIKGWIKKANYTKLMRAIYRKTPGLPENPCSIMAMRLLNGLPDTMVVIKEFYGINKLIEKVEEL